MEVKTCTKCGRTLPKNDEFFSTYMRHGKICFESQCKECRKNYFREYYAKNSEKYKALNQTWRQEHKEYKRTYAKEWRDNHKGYWRKYNDGRDWSKYNRAYYETHKEEDRCRCQKRRAREKEAEASFTTDEWEFVKIEFDNKCAYCGKALKLEQDHFVPLSKGGGYTKENIIPSCKRCNCSKHTSDFGEWYHSQPFYSAVREKHILQYLGKAVAV